VTDESRETRDPDGRVVVFDAGTCRHLAEANRGWLLEQVDAILGTVAFPDYREADPRPGRERFYRESILTPGRWLRVVVDFNEEPGWIVTALVQRVDPRPTRP
jgi:hypothetical protein